MSKSDYILSSDHEFWTAVKHRYLEWCKQQGVKPYTCGVDRCRNKLPCKRHPPGGMG